MSKKSNNYIGAIELEKKRDKLAARGSKSMLFKTYLSQYAEIINLNNSKFWDSLFMSGKKNYGKMHQKKIQIIENHIGLDKKDILSVGFGMGEIEKKLEKNGHLVSGIDISKYAVKKAKGRMRGEFKKAGVLKIPFSTSAFDVVLLLEIMEHVAPSNTFKAYSEIRRVLKKEGIVILSVPVNEPLGDMLKQNKNPNGHIRVYTVELISSEIELAGFRILLTDEFFAFEKSYGLKHLLQKTILKNRWKPNNIVILAEKKLS